VKGIVDWLAAETRLGRPAAVVLVIFGLFLLAWIVSRIAARLAVYFVDRSEKRRLRAADGADTGVITGLRQRETAISLVQTSVRYLAFALAFVLSLAALAGAHGLQTIVGASFLAIIVGFAAQRFLTDVIAGLLMFFEGWFRIGDTVAVDAWKAQGVVESVSLRSLTIRSITGEVFHVPNSQVTALRVIPRGYRVAELEFFVNALEAGSRLVDDVARIVPTGPTRFVRRPALVDTETLDDDLYRITARCAVAVGREWLVDDFLPSLVRERAAEGLLVHGPVVTYVDEQALRSFARAAVGTEAAPVPGAAGSIGARAVWPQ
jgi:moderate conductance mechanosensitive channel